ncbi:MAG: ABC transporter ATP-binding protein [Planctomycetota bacterium]
MNAPPAIDATDLTKRYARRRHDDVVALDGLTLSVPASSWVALLGPNGSGKSTLLRCITRAMRPDSGELRALGEDPGVSDASMRRRLSVVFQSPGLDRLLTVRENLLTQCALFGWSGREADDRLRAHAQSVGLTDRLDDRVGSLSGGLARRADLARALLSEPDLLLLDEPTTGLDPEARVSFLDLIERTRDERPGMTVLMSTHLMDEAERCDSIALLFDGVLLAHQTPDALRSGLGDRALRTGHAHADTLVASGLDVRAADGHVVGSGDRAALARAASRLAEAGAEFEVCAPSLEDVYLAHSHAGGGA